MGPEREVGWSLDGMLKDRPAVGGAQTMWRVQGRTPVVGRTCGKVKEPSRRFLIKPSSSETPLPLYRDSAPLFLFDDDIPADAFGGDVQENFLLGLELVAQLLGLFGGLNRGAFDRLNDVANAKAGGCAGAVFLELRHDDTGRALR